MQIPLPKTARVPECLTLGTLGFLFFTLSATAQEAPKILEPVPYQDPDLKTDVWIPSLKDGVAQQDMSHLSPADRRSYDDGWNTWHDRHLASASAGGDAVDVNLSTAGMRSAIDAHSFHQLDVAPDGTLWAFGGTYKASFGRDGATYHPFLGASAPRNFPVRLQLAETTVAGSPLALDLDSLPTFDGASAVYHRGALVERYDTRVGEVEQLFVIDRLESRGEISVRVNILTELAGSQDADGISWSNDLGSVRFSDAIAIDAAGRTTPASTMLDGDTLEILVPADFVAAAQLPLTIDPILATYFPSGSSVSADTDADIAYDTDNGRFAIVWDRAFSATDHDVWAEMFDVFGGPIASTGQYIEFTTDDWIRPKVANNRLATQFLVVAVKANVTPTEIWGREREAESLVQGAPLQISTGAGNKNFPDVGGDPHPSPPTYYCVTWEREFVAGVDHDVHAQLVNSSSALQGSIILVDNSSSTYDKYPNVSKSDGVEPASGQAWTIVWNRQFNASDWDVRGAQLGWSGSFLQESFSLDFSGAHDLLPKASTTLYPTGGERTYLTTYQRLGATEWGIQATALRGSTWISSANLSTLWGNTPGHDEEYPACDTNGSHFAVAYQHRFVPGGSDYDVWVAGVYLTGTTFHLSESPLNLAFSTSFEGYPEMCSRYGAGTTSDYCGIVWSDTSNNGDIEGGTYDMPNYYGQVGSTYCYSPANSSGLPGLIESTGTSYRSLNDLQLYTWQLPQNSTVFFLTSTAQGFIANAGGSQGNLCLGGSIGRYVGAGQVQNSGSSGAASLHLNLAQHPTPNGLVSVAAGQTWNFQAWYRDVGSTSNFTNAASVLFL